MSVFRFVVDQVITTRIEIDVEGRTRAEAETIAKAQARPQAPFRSEVVSVKRRPRRIDVKIQEGSSDDRSI